jgi:hypothetical protein
MSTIMEALEVGEDVHLSLLRQPETATLAGMHGDALQHRPASESDEGKAEAAKAAKENNGDQEAKQGEPQGAVSQPSSSNNSSSGIDAVIDGLTAASEPAEANPKASTGKSAASLPEDANLAGGDSTSEDAQDGLLYEQHFNASPLKLSDGAEASAEEASKQAAAANTNLPDAKEEEGDDDAAAGDQPGEAEMDSELVKSAKPGAAHETGGAHISHSSVLDEAISLAEQEEQLEARGDANLQEDDPTPGDATPARAEDGKPIAGPPDAEPAGQGVSQDKVPFKEMAEDARDDSPGLAEDLAVEAEDDAAEDDAAESDFAPVPQAKLHPPEAKRGDLDESPAYFEEGTDVRQGNDLSDAVLRKRPADKARESQAQDDDDVEQDDRTNQDDEDDDRSSLDKGRMQEGADNKFRAGVAEAADDDDRSSLE